VLSDGSDVARPGVDRGFIAEDKGAPHRLDHEQRHQRGGGVERDRDHEHRMPYLAATRLASGAGNEAVPLAVYNMPLLVVANLASRM
jgi:hypothetical protein